MGAEARAEGWSEGFRARFGAVVDRIGGTRAAAEVAGCSHDQISNYREGRSKIPLVTAHRLCGATGSSLDWLVDGCAVAMPAVHRIHSTDPRHLSDKAVQAAAMVVVEASRSFPTLAASDIADAIVSRAFEVQAQFDALTMTKNNVGLRNL